MLKPAKVMTRGSVMRDPAMPQVTPAIVCSFQQEFLDYSSVYKAK